MTREQAFWLMVVAALVAVFAKSFRAPSEHFWDNPPRIPISEQQAFEILTKSLGVEAEKPTPSQPAEATAFAETILEDEEPPKKVEQKEEKKKKKTPPPDPKPKPKPKPKPAPEPVLESKQPRTVLDKDAVNSMVTSVLPDLYGCYRYFADQARMNVDGEVLLAIDIDAHGAVTKVAFRRDPLMVPRMEECVASKFKGKEIYPPPSEPVVVRYPLTFTRPGAPNYEQLVEQYAEKP